MATDGPTPLAASPEIMDGPAVLLTNSVLPNATEGWVKRVGATSGQPVGWHFIGGRIVVRPTRAADIEKVLAALETHRVEWCALYRQHVDPFMPSRAIRDDEVPWQIRGGGMF